MDLKMPVMNGFEATGVIKTLLPNLPVIAITAYALSGDKKRALDAGCNDYLSKPISKEALSEKLKQFGVPTSSSFTQHQ
jgi:CheY-like chemotaxis protein